MIASRLGKISTESVRRRISRVNRSWGLLDQICCQSPSENRVKARTSARAASLSPLVTVFTSSPTRQATGRYTEMRDSTEHVQPLGEPCGLRRRLR
jgi:hypothetical protein